jgi:hypothetical protein
MSKWQKFGPESVQSGPMAVPPALAASLSQSRTFSPVPAFASLPGEPMMLQEGAVVGARERLRGRRQFSGSP